MEEINIIELVDKNAKTRFTKEYDNEFINKIKDKLEPKEHKLFLANFFLLLNFDAEKDFVIDFDKLWKWLGFIRKEQAKRILEKHFTNEIDYIVNKVENKEKILLNIDSYKLFSMKAGTKKSSEILDYYIRLHDLIMEVMNEQTDELKKQLQKFDEK
jgi:hypothetical protein